MNVGAALVTHPQPAELVQPVMEILPHSGLLPIPHTGQESLPRT